MFLGNDEGLRCRYWQNRTGSNYNATFIKGDDNNVVVYTGNSGKCPAENMQGISGVSGNMKYMQLSEDLTFYAETSLHRRCVTRMRFSGVLRPLAIIGTGDFVNSDGKAYRCDVGENKTMKSWSTYYCYVSRLEQLQNGDLFKMCPCPSESNRLDTYNGGGTEIGGVI